MKTTDKLKALCLLMTFMMLLYMPSGCANHSDVSQSDVSQPPSVASGGSDKDAVNEAEHGDGILKIGAPTDITTLDPTAFTDLPTQLGTTAIYSKLFEFDENLNVTPDLAKDWSNPSDLEWRITIKQGVKFHDGSDLKAEDVKASIERAKQSSLIQHIVAQIDRIDVVDDYTVLITTTVPFAPLLNNLSDPCLSILPKALIDSGNDFNKNPVGSGPYRFVEWKPSDKAVFERFDDYFNKDAISQYKTVELKVIPEGTSRAIALETGEVDIITQVETIDYERLSGNSDLKIYEVPANNMYYFTTNTEIEPFNNKLVRQAFEYAMDKESILEVAQDGRGTILDSITPKTILGYKPNSTYTYDPEKAKELLAEAGFVQGSEPFVLMSYSEMTNRIAQVIQSNLADVGVSVDIEQNVLGYHLEATGAGNFQMALSGWSTAPDPDRFLRPLYSSESINTNNISRYNNPNVTAMIDEGVAILDTDKRAQLYSQIHDIIMDDAAIVPLIGRVIIIASKASLRNVVMDPVNNMHFNTIRY